ncbi:Uu.00g070710.m01.CDS01 [Anthostomella pinea]|uniref:Uu.00g070710.m01.CDS01 n=1 Tax=Anthostomella pinea TaxID=933095 RepID=A0AAI8VUS5_9PEZI|nr:Uu.00g070710.m01.CDS01 [Anthostomella pinea]
MISTNLYESADLSDKRRMFRDQDWVETSGGFEQNYAWSKHSGSWKAKAPPINIAPGFEVIAAGVQKKKKPGVGSFAERSWSFGCRRQSD